MDTRKSHSDSQTNPVTCTVLYTKSNALRLARVVGSQRCSHMISSDKQVYMLVTGGDEDIWMVMVFCICTMCKVYTFQSGKALNTVIAASFGYWNGNSSSWKQSPSDQTSLFVHWNLSLLGRIPRFNVDGMALQRSMYSLRLFLTCEHSSWNQQSGNTALISLGLYHWYGTSHVISQIFLVAIMNVAKNCTVTSMFKQNETFSLVNKCSWCRHQSVHFLNYIISWCR